jgi:deoxyribonuclease V
LAAAAQLESLPDVFLFDGQGYAHPRRLGLAAHLGLWLGTPSVGCAKTRLVGRHADVPEKKGGWTPLTDGEETIGAVLRTREGVKPVFVSRGHLCDLDSAVSVVMAAVGRYRLPEPIRAAHALCNEVRRSFR